MRSNPDETLPNRLYFASGAVRDMPYVTKFPILGLDDEGRVVVDITSELGPEPDGSPRLFGLTLCCFAFDKGYEDGVYCRACASSKVPFDRGTNWPNVVDPFTSATPWLRVPGHINDVTERFCSGEGSVQLGGRCPYGCDHADHYSNDGHLECVDDAFMKQAK